MANHHPCNCFQRKPRVLLGNLKRNPADSPVRHSTAGTLVLALACESSAIKSLHALCPLSSASSIALRHCFSSKPATPKPVDLFFQRNSIMSRRPCSAAPSSGHRPLTTAGGAERSAPHSSNFAAMLQLPWMAASWSAVPPPRVAGLSLTSALAARSSVTSSRLFASTAFCTNGH